MNSSGQGRLTIGLYNTYDVRDLREAHRRALARAATLAEAFDWNLAIFGFPLQTELDTPEKLTDWLSSTTSVGEDGRYSARLSELGRLTVFPFPRRGFPPQLGELIVTTRRPWDDRRISIRELAMRALAGESFLLLFGLGRKGLPDWIFEMSRLHLDVTDRGRSLETCTAIGAVVGSTSAALRLLSES